MNRLLLIASVMLLSVFSTSWAQKQITLEDLNKNNTFKQNTLTGIKPDNAGETYTKLEGNTVVRYSYATGDVIKTVFDLTKELREPPFENHYRLPIKPR